MALVGEWTGTQVGEWTGTKEHSTQHSTYEQASVPAPPRKERVRGSRGAMCVLLADWAAVTRGTQHAVYLWHGTFQPTSYPGVTKVY